MKRMFLTCVLAICCVLTGYGQFWISFHWDSPGCDQCVRMESALRLSPKSAEKYHKIIHKYGKKIEKEARREYRYWDRAAERIYDLRMSRDREIQRLLSPSQFDLYIRLTRENPKRIHDYRGWYANPHYPDRKASTICIHFEDRYWGFQCHRLRHRTGTCRRHHLPVTTIRKSPSIRKSVTRRKSISESTNESMSTSIGIESS